MYCAWSMVQASVWAARRVGKDRAMATAEQVVARRNELWMVTGGSCGWRGTTRKCGRSKLECCTFGRYTRSSERSTVPSEWAPAPGDWQRAYDTAPETYSAALRGRRAVRLN
jgi:hypothetical protein